MAVTDQSAEETSAVLVGGELIERCGHCDTPVRLRRPTVESPASAWLCRRCGSVFFASSQEEPAQRKPSYAMAKAIDYYEVTKELNRQLVQSSKPISSSDAKRLIDFFANRQFMGTNTRHEERAIVTASVTVIPLSADFRIAARAERALTMNVSSGGAALLHGRNVPQPFLAVDFNPSGVNLLPVILQKTRVRQMAASYEIAGRFVCRINV